ncbi:N utilization substance protein B [Alsobacter metallidurans]|uniref:Transcription antitermination protein NusB n=1 Tax=Alsobacter metallidurans TaxID=340221 RepID=A0A917MGV7_9HYPH|nr:transcription antitermination factor NusB [Alsobacter metallidurans]GGH17470.1 N utilization substance protein B [Alsobacter metallidurans]
MSKGENRGDKREKRSAARLAAVQTLYEMELSGKGVLDAVAEYEAHWMGREIEDMEFKPADAGFFREIVSGVVEDQRLVDQKVDAALAKGWPLKRIEAVLRAILRAGAYELIRRQDVPARVAITEYVDVANAFYDGDEAGMVNGVLDTIARDVRGDELTKQRA